MSNKRENTKLQKTLSPINILSLALGSIIGWGAFVMPGDTFLPNAGPFGAVIGILVGAGIMMIISVSYGYMIQRTPIAGGEFAYSYEGFGRIHAFICAWFLGLSYLSIVPLNATALGLIGRYMFPGLLQRGFLYTIAGWEVYLGEIIFSSLALIIFAYINIRGTQISGTIQTIITFSLVGAIFFLSIGALIHPEAKLSNLRPGFSSNTMPLAGILQIVAISPWAFVGFDTIPQAAEEFNFSHKKALNLMLTSIFLGALMYIAMNTITASAFPWEPFIQSEPFWATGMAVEELFGSFGMMLLAIAMICAVFSGILGFYNASSRLLLSMARAQALPEWFSKIDSKKHTPRNAVLFVLLFSLITPWFGRQVLVWVVDMASVGAAIGYFYTSATVFKISRRNRETAKGIQTIGLLGAVMSLGFVLLLLVPGSPAYLSLPSRIAFGVWIILGIIFYAVSSKKYMKQSKEELEKRIFGR